MINRKKIRQLIFREFKYYKKKYHQQRKNAENYFVDAENKLALRKKG